MTNQERAIRLDAAEEAAHKVYSDMCSDQSFTREELLDFCDLLVGMQKLIQSLKDRG